MRTTLFGRGTRQDDERATRADARDADRYDMDPYDGRPAAHSRVEPAHLRVRTQPHPLV